jgi:hypothetical protein
VLGPIFVAGDDAAADAAVARPLAGIVEEVAVAVQRSIIWAQTEDFSPSQIGESTTRMSAAITFSKIAGQSSRFQPCSVMSG